MFLGKETVSVSFQCVNGTFCVIFMSFHTAQINAVSFCINYFVLFILYDNNMTSEKNHKEH